MGVGPPSVWQLPHLSRRIGYTSSLYVYFDVIPLWASMWLVVTSPRTPAAIMNAAPRARRDFTLPALRICGLQIGHRGRQPLIGLRNFLAVTEIAVAIELPRRGDHALHRTGHEHTLPFGQRRRVRVEDERDGLRAGCRQ